MKVRFSFLPKDKALLFVILHTVCLSTIISGVILHYKGQHVVSTFMLIVSFASLYSLLTFLLLELYRKADERRKAAEYLKMNDTYKKEIDNMRSIQHDLKNQLLVLNGFFKKDNNKPEPDIVNFLKLTGNQVNDISVLLKMDNTVIGMLLFSKYKLACEKGIEFKIKSYVADITNSSLFKYDLVAILGNLLDNAIEAGGPGDEINVEIGEISGFIYFSVMNSGDLPKADIDALFAPGYSTKGENRGYGLSNVRKMVMKHGGNIELSLNEGKIEFRIYLPRSA